MIAPRPGSRAEQRRRTEARILDAAAQAFLTAGYEPVSYTHLTLPTN